MILYFLLLNVGENILHLLIVQKNLTEIKWLLEFYDNHKHSVPYGLEILLKTNVKGTFFEDDGDFIAEVIHCISR